MSKINSFVVGAFFAAFIILIALFIMQNNQKVDAQSLKTDMQLAQSVISEAMVINENKDKQTEQYFTSQLQDLSKKMNDVREGLKGKKFEDSIANKKENAMQLIDNVENKIQILSQSFNEPEQRDSIKADLISLQNKIKMFIQTV